MSGLSDPLSYKKFFNQFGGDYNNSREIESYDNLQAEYAAIYGIPVEYYPISIDAYAENLDPILGENGRPIWDRKYGLTALMDEYSQELLKWEAAGQMNVDEIVLYIHRSTFDKIVGIRSNKAPSTDPTRRGAWGPAPKDMLRTPYNGHIYEVVTGGLHFLDSQAKHFGHKFWYKVTLKSREVSDAAVGAGEQYGALPDMTLQEMIDAGMLDEDGGYVCNPQAVVGTPDIPDQNEGAGTRPLTGMPDVCPDYTTVGAPSGPSDGTVPDDLLLTDGRVADKYNVPGERPLSRQGDQKEIARVTEEIFDPQTNEKIQEASAAMTYNSEGTIVYVETGQPVPEGSDDWNIFLQNHKYGPTGTIIRHNRDIWGGW